MVPRGRAQGCTGEECRPRAWTWMMGTPWDLRISPSVSSTFTPPKKARKKSANKWVQHRWYIYIYVYIYIFFFFWGGQFGMKSGDWCFFILMCVDVDIKENERRQNYTQREFFFLDLIDNSKIKTWSGWTQTSNIFSSKVFFKTHSFLQFVSLVFPSTSNYSHLKRPISPQKVAFWKGQWDPLFHGKKSRLVKYYFIWLKNQPKNTTETTRFREFLSRVETRTRVDGWISHRLRRVSGVDSKTPPKEARSKDGG